MNTEQTLQSLAINHINTTNLPAGTALMIEDNLKVTYAFDIDNSHTNVCATLQFGGTTDTIEFNAVYNAGTVVHSLTAVRTDSKNELLRTDVLFSHVETDMVDLTTWAILFGQDIAELYQDVQI